MTKYVKKIGIIGAGGAGKDVLCCIMDMLSLSQDEVAKSVAFIVNDEFLTDELILGIQVIPFSAFNADSYQVVVAIGDSKKRKKVVENLPADTTYFTVIHPSVIMSQWVKIGEGSIIAAGSILTCNIEIGKHSHLNLHSTISHDCRIGDYFTTSPAVNISGNCTIGACVYVGTNASLRNGVSICDDVIIGMGAVVNKDITKSGTYIGNPVKILERPV